MANARVSSCQAALAVARSVARAGQWRFLSCVLRAQLAGAARLGGWDSVRWQAGRQAGRTGLVSSTFTQRLPPAFGQLMTTRRRAFFLFCPGSIGLFGGDSRSTGR